MTEYNSLSAFFADNAERAEDAEAVISDRFKGDDNKPIKWKFRALAAAELKNVRNMCYTTDAKGKRVVDEEAAAVKCIALSVVYPDLNNTDLQASYNARNAADLLQNMLYVNEFNKAAEVFQDMNMLENDSLEAQVETVKNS